MLDVLPEETYEKRHIPTALNACVYEIEFSEKVESLIPDKSRAIVVYGQNNLFEAAPLAYEKLVSKGWTNVAILNGGFEAWKQLGYPVKGSGEKQTPLNGRFDVSTERSTVRWVGRNLLNQHNGVIGLERANLVLENDQLVGGTAVLDMNRIVCEDIEDPSVAQVLINHLRTDDFFLADQYPTAQFELQSAEPITGAKPGSPNYALTGSFTLRGQTEPLRFPATLGTNDEVIALQASFDFDRVLWGSKYGSGKIYEALGKHVVNDLISISFQLIAPLR